MTRIGPDGSRQVVRYSATGGVVPGMARTGQAENLGLGLALAAALVLAVAGLGLRRRAGHTA